MTNIKIFYTYVEWFGPERGHCQPFGNIADGSNGNGQMIRAIVM